MEVSPEHPLVEIHQLCGEVRERRWRGASREVTEMAPGRADVLRRRVISDSVCPTIRPDPSPL